ncbi:MAG: DNA polymerase/3'-5' exonuclease PolX [Candidatus Sericytochromatia bacterium]|nr:DNA polymerase/3'-5' exonuclease PolX [Candidatus Tanganyikabacteria bacterium]
MADKRRAARLLREIAAMLELEGENPFKVRAYADGADAVECMEGDLGAAVRSGAISGVKGIGKGLRAELEAFVDTGTLPLYEGLAARYPDAVRELLHIPGFGPKKVRAVLDELGIRDLDELEAAGKAGRLAGLKGFGAKTQDKILRNIAFYRANKGKRLYSAVAGVAQDILDRVAAFPGVVRCDVAGSLRRAKEVVKDIDLVAAAADPEPVMAAFVALPEVVEVVGRGLTKTSVRLDGGLAVDVRVVTDEQYPYALLHFTGSAEHNTLLRGRAKALGLKLNEYGLFREADGSLVPCADEAAIYAALGLDCIPPELRDAGGWEVEVAERRALPVLVARPDIRGVFHNHTTNSDGHATLDEMIDAARRLGFSYLGISDHTKAAGYANGLDDSRVRAQHAEIDARNASLAGFRVLKGVEADILRDGAIDLAPATLAGCDFVIASIHSRFSETREQMTERICRALANPLVTILGHVSGRLLLEREPYELDYDRLFAVSAEHGVLIEINGNPERLDLDWRLLQQAKGAGVRFCINPDAHSTEAIAHFGYGVNVARKGGLEPGDILNTGDLPEVLEYLAGRKARQLAALG